MQSDPGAFQYQHVWTAMYDCMDNILSSTTKFESDINCTAKYYKDVLLIPLCIY